MRYHVWLSPQIWPRKVHKLETSSSRTRTMDEDGSLQTNLWYKYLRSRSCKEQGPFCMLWFPALVFGSAGLPTPWQHAGESSFHITDANVLSLRLCQNPCIAGLQTNAHGEAWSNKNTIQLWSQFVRQHNPCKKQRISAFLVWQMRDVWDND